jgi:Ca-activated chloride channel homolog
MEQPPSVDGDMRWSDDALQEKGCHVAKLARALPGLLAVLCCGCFLTEWGVAQTFQVTLVTSHFCVTDHSGRYISDLNRDDFLVTDNGVPQEITDFGRTSRGALSVAMVLDRSESISDRFQFVKEAAATCAQSLLQSPEDRGLLVAFDSKAYLLQDWTSDPDSLTQNVQKLTSAGGSSLFDAIYKASRDRFRVADERRKVLILFSDGEDTTSRATLRQALEMVKLSGATIYAIGIRPENSLNTRELQGRRVLAEFAGLTGGSVIYAQQDEQIDAFLKRLEDEVRNWYEISYYSNAPLDDSFHKLVIQTKKEALQVRGPKGYYADKPRELP